MFKPYKNLNGPDNHDSVITHLEPDILECEVKWTLGSITTNKASGGDGISAKLFQILKDDAVKVVYPEFGSHFQYWYSCMRSHFSHVRLFVTL